MTSNSSISQDCLFFLFFQGQIPLFCGVMRGWVVKCLTLNPWVLGSSCIWSFRFFMGVSFGKTLPSPSLVLVKLRKDMNTFSSMNITMLKAEQNTFDPLFWNISHLLTVKVFNPLPNNPLLLRVCSANLLKTLWEKGKLLVPNCFLRLRRTFCHFHQV